MTPASSPLLPAAVICGAGAGLGLWLAITALLPACPGSPQGANLAAAWWSRHHSRQPPAALARRAGLALTAAVAAGRSPAGQAGPCWPAWQPGRHPACWDPTGPETGPVARIEGIAGWTEKLRDTPAAADGLEQAILATAPLSPEAMREQVTALAGRLATRVRLDGALRDFAAEVADPVADLVVAALMLAADQQARGLGELLSSLAASARPPAAMRCGSTPAAPRCAPARG